MSTQQTYLYKAIMQANPIKIAEKSNVSVRAVYKWLDNDRLPRTELTEETDYSSVIAKLCNDASLYNRDKLISYTRKKWKQRSI